MPRRVTIISGSGAPAAGTSFVYTLTIGGTPTSGSFRLAVNGRSTMAITWSATNNTLVANVDAALEALALIGSGGVTTAVGTMTAGIGTITITGAGAWAKRKAPTITVAANNLAGTAPTVAIALTTPGVTPTAKDEPAGVLYLNSANGKVYSNTGTPASPTWTAVGDQTA
jgi:hypothetical protein